MTVAAGAGKFTGVFRSFVAALALSCAFSGTAFCAGDLAEALKSGDIWTLSRTDLSNRYFVGERYAPISDNEIRLLCNSSVVIGDLKPREIVMTWKDDRLESMLIMVYNKGDDGAIDRKAFDDKVAATRAALDDIAGQQGRSVKIAARESGIDVDAWEWTWDGGAMRLEAAATKKRREFVAEFVRLTIGATTTTLARGNASDSASKSDLKNNVRRDNDSVVIEGIPMVDQGQKGYCVPAAVSRVFAYYGMDGVDQHALAAICGSSGTGGTSHTEMVAGLQKIGGKFHFKVIPLDDARSDTSWVGEYDKLAKKMKKTPLPTSSSKSDAWNYADKDVLRAVRAGKPAQVEKWMKPVRKSIDEGIPVLWSVMLGIFPEAVATPQTRGGHMRLIIGYNDKTKTIVFTDTWGAGHEKKELPAADAAAMTRARYQLRPAR